MLTDRQQSILDIFLENPNEPKSVSDFSSFEMERTTVFRDLKKMTQDGLLVLEGKSYRINQASDAYLIWDLTRPPQQRPSVRYNPDLLDNYKPNETFLLTDTHLNALEHAGAVSGIREAKELGKPYERVLSSLLIDLTHASSNLENVNISWLDTKTLIEFGERPNGLSDKQMRIVLNHKEAIAYLKEHGRDMVIGKKDLMDIHSLLTQGLLGDPSAVGALRSVVVKFDDSRYCPPDNQHQLQEIFNQFSEKACEIDNPHEQAFFTMLFVPYIQPFQDGNKRTSRIAMNIPLVKNELAPFSFSDMSKRDYMFGLLAFYERGRHEFLADTFSKAYERSAERYSELIQHISEGGLLNSISDTKMDDTGDEGGDGKTKQRTRSRGRGQSM
jgi:Fic family protein